MGRGKHPALASVLHHHKFQHRVFSFEVRLQILYVRFAIFIVVMINLICHPFCLWNHRRNIPLSTWVWEHIERREKPFSRVGNLFLGQPRHSWDWRGCSFVCLCKSLMMSLFILSLTPLLSSQPSFFKCCIWTEHQ